MTEQQWDASDPRSESEYVRRAVSGVVVMGVGMLLSFGFDCALGGD